MKALDLSQFIFNAIIFDCDGTLVDSAPLHYEAFYQALIKHQCVLNKSWYRERLGLSRHELLIEFKKQNGCLYNIDEVAVETEQNYLKLIDHIDVVPEVVAAAKQYHKVLPMAVASSGQTQSVSGSLRSAGLLYLFDHLVTADDVRKCKPDPDVFLEAARRLNVEPSLCLVIEDSDEGIEAARRAGAQPIDIRNHVNLYC